MMRLDEVLRDITLLGFDTAPSTYFVERHPACLDVMRTVLRRVEAGIITGYSSVVTLTEVLTLPIRVGNIALAQAYRDVPLHSCHFVLVSSDAAVTAQATDLRARYMLRTPDALQIAAALHRGCRSL